MRKLLIIGALLVASLSMVSTACVVRARPVGVSYSYGGYSPNYYNGNTVYLNTIGRPYYYSSGRLVYVPRSWTNYNRTVSHWNRNRGKYNRWHGRYHRPTYYRRSNRRRKNYRRPARRRRVVRGRTSRRRTVRTRRVKTRRTRRRYH
jgi:hypothetical protein